MSACVHVCEEGKGRETENLKQALQAARPEPDMGLDLMNLRS